jgi:hypothetical protein
MIIEFRGGSVGAGPKGAEGFLTPAEWLEFAFDYFNLVRQLHGAEAVPEWDEFKPVPPPEPEVEVKAKPKPKARKSTTKVRRGSTVTTPRRRGSTVTTSRRRSDSESS